MISRVTTNSKIKFKPFPAAEGVVACCFNIKSKRTSSSTFILTQFNRYNFTSGVEGVVESVVACFREKCKQNVFKYLQMNEMPTDGKVGKIVVSYSFLQFICISFLLRES